MMNHLTVDVECETVEFTRAARDAIDAVEALEDAVDRLDGAEIEVEIKDGGLM